MCLTLRLGRAGCVTLYSESATAHCSPVHMSLHSCILSSTELSETHRKMTSIRRTHMNDLLKFNNVNLDPLTETVLTQALLARAQRLINALCTAVAHKLLHCIVVVSLCCCVRYGRCSTACPSTCSTWCTGQSCSSQRKCHSSALEAIVSAKNTVQNGCRAVICCCSVLVAGCWLSEACSCSRLATAPISVIGQLPDNFLSCVFATVLCTMSPLQ